LAQTTELGIRVANEPARVEPTRSQFCFTPQVDIYETPEQVVLQCDVPGAQANDIDIRFERGELTVNAKVVPRKRPGKYLAEEYETGDFYRTFSINSEIDSEKITADCREGVLTLHLPKLEKARPKQIVVKSG